MKRTLCLALSVAFCTPAVAQPCSPYWVAMPPAVGGNRTMLTFDDGSGVALYKGAPSLVQSGAQRWRGDHWEFLADGLPSDLRVGAEVFVLNDGTGPKLHLVARRSSTGWTSYIWTGQQWIPGPPGFVLEQSNGLYMGGPWFSHDFGSGPAIYGGINFPGHSALTRWNGESWDIIAETAQGRFSSQVVYDHPSGPALYMSGSFTNIAGSGLSRMARWDGTNWTQVGADPEGPLCREMTFVEEAGGPALYCLHCSNPRDPDCLRRLEGQQWVRIPGPDVPPGLVATVRAMVAFDDGSGPSLYLGGSFPMIGGIESRGLARWDGNMWHPVGNGISGEAIRFGVFYEDPRGPSLIVFGVTGTRPGQTPSMLAQLVGCPSCYANCDNSTTHPLLNVDDFTCFIDKFAVQDPYANCNQDSTIDVEDFMCFINKFAQGCQ